VREEAEEAPMAYDDYYYSQTLCLVCEVTSELAANHPPKP
jgi:hypothetical protein